MYMYISAATAMSSMSIVRAYGELTVTLKFPV